MSRHYKLYLRDILEASDKIESYVRGIDVETFLSSSIVSDSVLFNLMTIGEAVKNIPEELRKTPDVRWREIIRFRDRIVHHYFSLDLDVIWEIATLHLPVLKTAVEKILIEIPDEDEGSE